MNAVDADVELIPAEFQAEGCECFDMFFTGVGMRVIHVKLLRPKQFTQPHPRPPCFMGIQVIPAIGWIN